MIASARGGFSRVWDVSIRVEPDFQLASNILQNIENIFKQLFWIDVDVFRYEATQER